MVPVGRRAGVPTTLMLTIPGSSKTITDPNQRSVPDFDCLFLSHWSPQYYTTSMAVPLADILERQSVLQTSAAVFTGLVFISMCLPGVVLVFPVSFVHAQGHRTSFHRERFQSHTLGNMRVLTTLDHSLLVIATTDTSFRSYAHSYGGLLSFHVLIRRLTRCVVSCWST